MLITGVATYAQSQWNRISIDARVSVMLPGTPEKNETEQSLMYTLASPDSSVFNVNVIDFVSYGLDSATLQGLIGEEAFMEQFKSGIIQQMEQAEVLEARITNLDSFTVYEFLIELTLNDGAKRNFHSYNLFIGSKLYSFTISAIKDEELVKAKFISSIVVK